MINIFYTSNSQLEGFKKSNGALKKCGENNALHIGIRTQWIEELPRSLYDNFPDDIFKVYRTRLFFKWVPDKAFTSKGDQCLGGILSYNPFKCQYAAILG